MKRMHRIVALLLLMVILFGTTAQADVIITPENDYFLTHKKECEQYERTHYINTKRGALGVYDAPDGRVVLNTLQNAEEVFIMYTCDDEKWGLVHYSADGQHIFGWIEMKHTVLKYDNISFLEEYSAQFYEDTEYIAQTMLEGFEDDWRIYTYPYPGAKYQAFMKAKHLFVLKRNYKFEHLFTDENGRIWGYCVQSKYGNWICLSDPQNPDLPESVRQELDLYPASDIEITSEYIPTWILPTCLVVGVAAISGVLLLMLKRRKAKGT